MMRREEETYGGVTSYAYDEFGLPIGDKKDVIGFTGYMYDDVSELYFAQARWYDQSIGRFVSEDRIRGNTAQPESLNRYNYCRANPLRYVDLNGLDIFSDVGNWIGKAASDAWEWTTGAVSDAVNWVGNAATDVWENNIYGVDVTTVETIYMGNIYRKFAETKHTGGGIIVAETTIDKQTQRMISSGSRLDLGLVSTGLTFGEDGIKTGGHLGIKNIAEINGNIGIGEKDWASLEANAKLGFDGEHTTGLGFGLGISPLSDVKGYTLMNRSANGLSVYTENGVYTKKIIAEALAGAGFLIYYCPLLIPVLGTILSSTAFSSASVDEISCEGNGTGRNGGGFR